MINNKKKTVILLLITITLTSLITFKFSSKKTKTIIKYQTKQTNNIKCSPNKIKKNDNIVFLGDSITDYYPIDSIYDDLPIVNSGVEGYKTTDVMDKLDTMVYIYNPTKVFILIGTNDIMYDKDNQIEYVTNNIKNIVEDIHKNRQRTKIYIQSLYPINKDINPSLVRDRDNEKIKDINKILLNYCKKEKISYINIYDKLTDDDGNFDKKYTNDGLHPSDLGYAKITKLLLPYIYE